MCIQGNIAMTANKGSVTRDFVVGFKSGRAQQQVTLQNSLKDFKRYVDLMKLLTAFLDVLQARYHEISVKKCQQ